MARRNGQRNSDSDLPSVMAVADVGDELTGLEDGETILGDGTKIIEVPLGRLFPGYIQRRVDVQKMTRVQKLNLKRLLIGLVATETHLANGKKVKNGQDAIKWVLEQLGDPGDLP